MGTVIRFDKNKRKRTRTTTQEVNPKLADPKDIAKSLRNLFTEEQLAAIRKDLENDNQD